MLTPSLRCSTAWPAPSASKGDEIEGEAVVAVLLSPDGRVIAQRGTVVGGEA